MTAPHSQLLGSSSRCAASHLPVRPTPTVRRGFNSPYLFSSIYLPNPAPAPRICFA
ncbi:hypothetical protein B0H19DRAFT_1115610 [Mycena capillaripes]|nr:hypothetical protein B0H19DRAFT_1115610 [Mycena capillaripes]